MKIKCKENHKIYEDVRSLKVFREGKEYDVSQKLGEKLVEMDVAEVVKEKKEKKQGGKKKEDK